MTYNMNIEGIRLDIQAVDFELDDSFLGRIEAALARIRRFYSGDIVYADFYLKRETSHSVNEKSLHIKLGIPGRDPFAAEKGDDWGQLLKNATEQIIKQVQKQHK
ncbi:HPF/RaiA family ribosome-associated protein [Telluribacter sp.]|jgi:putative sigma-54 modulation protein|uniref:HPF/RaiA family ribosome-associated protein n=1 Tax=Telluribacter sp. TaxID=1978767 RepID=UPI002E16613C|nr:HPF/RaiA family ribosome-associated protein [Telluribacter sp.]